MTATSREICKGEAPTKTGTVEVPIKFWPKNSDDSPMYFAQSLGNGTTDDGRKFDLAIAGTVFIIDTPTGRVTVNLENAIDAAMEMSKP